MDAYAGLRDNCRGQAIAVDGNGDVYVTAQVQNEEGFFDYATMKYSRSGSQSWVAEYRYSVNGDHVPVDIAVDDSGYVYVTGYSQGGPSSYDYATIKYRQRKTGDVNSDGMIDLGDAIYLLNYLFKGGPAPVPSAETGDVNCDQTVNVADAIYLLNYLFKGSAGPCG